MSIYQGGGWMQRGLEFDEAISDQDQKNKKTIGGGVEFRIKLDTNYLMIFLQT
jgi:hypothetical protein